MCVYISSTFAERVRARAVHPRFRRFARVFTEERLELSIKSLKRQTKAEEEETRSP
jgi:hypothetical protein